MLKSISILIAAAVNTAPALAETFVHDGSTYVYTVEQRGNFQILKGEVTESHKPFTLRVSRTWVDGEVDGSPVSFSKRAVVRLKPTVTTTEIAAR
jgi:hypothetical protein